MPVSRCRRRAFETRAQRSFSKVGVRAGGDSDEGETCGPEPRRAAGLDAGRNPVPLAWTVFTGMLFWAFWASCVFGSVTVNTPFLNVASILSISPPSGSCK
jgi:hypothetical protein